MAKVPASTIRQVVNLRELLRADVEQGAKALLGCLLVKGDMSAQIVETEAYTWDDPGCHAYKKEHMKNMAMYGEPGTAYVYFTYGNHWMINVVADQGGRARLVAAAEWQCSLSLWPGQSRRDESRQTGRLGIRSQTQK